MRTPPPGEAIRLGLSTLDALNTRCSRVMMTGDRAGGAEELRCWRVSAAADGCGDSAASEKTSSLSFSTPQQHSLPMALGKPERRGGNCSPESTQRTPAVLMSISVV